MIRTTEDPRLATMLQTYLQDDLALYEGAIDGAWGPKSDLAFQVHCNYERYAKLPANALSAAQMADMAKFLKNWKSDNLQRYRAVANAAHVPIELVAALHWRESGGDFATYLHNGDPLGQPTVHVPVGLYFSSWITAAIDAISREKAAFAQSGIDPDGNITSMCIFAEYYNGEGYCTRGVPDPYILAGTSPARRATRRASSPRTASTIPPPSTSSSACCRCSAPSSHEKTSRLIEVPCQAGVQFIAVRRQGMR